MSAAVPTRLPRFVAWQGWRIDLPRRWDPVKLDGDTSAGHALFADTLRPRLGLRWQTPRRRRFDAAAAVHRTLIDEVGQLAAAEAHPWSPPAGEWTSPLLYVEPDPPGRDVWVGYSPTSGRLLSVACPVRRREHLLANVILPTLADLPLDRAAAWSVFDLSLVVPGGFALADRRLNAGDLSLSFADRRGAKVSVRQVAVAELALRRRPLDGWLADQQRGDRRHHRSAGPTTDVAVSMAGRSLPGRCGHLRRRRRFALAAWHPRSLVTLAVHDADRDRLVILSGTDEDLLRSVAGTVGGAMHFR
jgi:hypothetical protein